MVKGYYVNRGRCKSIFRDALRVPIKFNYARESECSIDFRLGTKNIAVARKRARDESLVRMGVQDISCLFDPIPCVVYALRVTGLCRFEGVALYIGYSLLFLL